METTPMNDKKSMIYLWLTPMQYEGVKNQVEMHDEHYGIIAARTKSIDFLQSIKNEHILAQVKRERYVLPTEEHTPLEIQVAQIAANEHSTYKNGIYIRAVSRKKFSEEDIAELMKYPEASNSSVLQSSSKPTIIRIRPHAYEAYLEQMINEVDENESRIHSFVDDALFTYLSRLKHSEPRERSPIFWAKPADLKRPVVYFKPESK